MSEQSLSGRLFLLDISRAIAALAVVISHYSHFFHFPSVDFGPTESQPGYVYLSSLYDYGGFAVQYFFALSGFIFYYFYAQNIHIGRVSLANFFVLRFSRLYPLHAATLVIVALLQVAVFSFWGDFFIYERNDFYHFILNLLFIQNWGLELGASFNGPTWSVSLELLAYGLFFFVALIFRSSLALTLIVAALGFVVMRKINFPIGMVVGCFFAGGAAALAYNILVPVLRRLNILTTASVVLFLFSLLIWFSIAPLDLEFIRNEIVWGVSMPLMVLSLALMQAQYARLGEGWARFGDITYASYLIHFPVQLLMAPIMALLAISPTSWLVLLLYIGLVIWLSFFVFERFEMPVQNFIRRTFLNRSVSSRGAAP